MLHTSKVAPPVVPDGDSLYHILLGNNTNVPFDKPILIDIESPFKSLTHGQLRRQTLIAAAGLKRVFGVQRLEVVAICSPNHIDYFSIVHGIICTGAVAAPLDYTSMAEDIANDLKTVQAKYMVTHIDVVDKALMAAKEAGIDESSIVIFGTTGRKKAVVKTHNNLLHSTIRTTTVNPSVAMLSYLNFYHATALVTVLLMAPYYGCTYHLLNHYSFPGLCAAIEKYKPVFITCAPYVVSSLLKDNIAKEYDISSLKSISSSGSHLKQSVILEAYKQLGIAVLSMYGLTEVLGFFTTTPEISLKLGGVGVLRNTRFTARIVDEDGRDVATGQAGELLIKGPTLSPGYYRSSECLIDQDGFFHTGDLFRCNEDGVFFFCDRLKDLMKYYTTHIYPGEIEGLLLKHPKVADCAVVGIFQAEVGVDLPRAYVVLVDGEPSSQALIDELQAFSDDQLPEKKRVHAGIVIVESLPRTSSGKVQRRLLKESANNIHVRA
ncbi:hypothetical protein MBANPS3_009978 [Mucor bainieri]